MLPLRPIRASLLIRLIQLHKLQRSDKLPTWGKVLTELTESATPTRPPDFDLIRRNYLRNLHDLTGRAIILYASAWFESRPISPAELQIGLPDIQGLMEAASNIDEPELDLILHSPGGSAEAAESLKEPENLAAWMPILRTYAPGLLTQCEDSHKLASDMVAGWLERYMLLAEPDSNTKARRIANWFADYESFNSHGRRVGRDQARQIGVKVSDLEDSEDLQDAVLSVHHATMHTFAGTSAQKIIENHHGRAWVRMHGPEIQIPAMAIPSIPSPPDEPSSK